MNVTHSNHSGRARRFWGVLALLVIMLVALVPWAHNRGYVRSFFDYGVVIGAVGRIESGQHPYVDFITPIQTSWYLWNWAAERLGDGTFQAMTLSAAACVVMATLLLGGILWSRWPVWAVFLVTGAIVNATVIQHTIMWYNPWGVVLLAVVVWAAALAPVLRRETWLWHVLLGLALLLGGINKINMQLMALAMAAGWTSREMLRGRSGWGRALLTLLYFGVMGLVLPVVVEMAWTGATFAQWWHNVVASMAGNRADMLLGALKWQFYMKPYHDYYGPLRLPQIGLVGVIMTVLTVIAIWRHPGKNGVGLQRLLGTVCGVIALLAGVVLLTTNMDIAYIGLGGWLAVLIGLWLGFDLPARGPWFYSALVVPSVLISLVSWESAWRGQRSQFGYSDEPRSAYISGDQAGSDFGYFRGTHLPTGIFAGMKAMGQWRAAMPQERQARILYGPGTEWAGHIWPSPVVANLPLYILGGGLFSAREYEATYDAVNSGKFTDITVSLPRDVWEPALQTILQLKYTRTRFDGGVYFLYSRANSGGVSVVPVRYLSLFGGNADSRFIDTTGRFIAMKEAGQMFLGTTTGEAAMKLNALTNRVHGQVVVHRKKGAPEEALSARFTIFAEYDAAHHFPRWDQVVVLPAGQEQVVADYAIDSSGMATGFYVEIPQKSAGKIEAGWRNPSITHSSREGPEQPTWLYHNSAPAVRLTDAEMKRLLPAGATGRPAVMMFRGGHMTGDGVVLDEGGELWVQAQGFITEFSGTATLVGKVTGPAPMVRGMWVKDARIEDYTPRQMDADHTVVDFHSWCAEPGGWIVIAVDPGESMPPVLLRVEKYTHGGGS